MKISELKTKINIKLSFWSALKLRLSGITSIEERVGQISKKYSIDNKKIKAIKHRDIHKFINIINLIYVGMSINSETHAINKIIDLMRDCGGIGKDKLYEFEKNLLFIELSELDHLLLRIDRISFESAVKEYYEKQGKEIVNIKRKTKKK